MKLNLGETYIYKLGRLTKALDAALDQTLRQHAGISLAHFVLLFAIRDHKQTNSQTIAGYLDISPGAISRQIELATNNGWIARQNDTGDRRRQLLELTPEGEKILEQGIGYIELIRPTILKDEDSDATLMDHFAMMQKNIEDLKPR